MGAPIPRAFLFIGGVDVKNKKLKSFLCFLLAFIVLFSFPLEIKAHAAALEAAWLTYVIITYMAACGIVFTATGGAQALANAVNEAWDDWTETQTEIIDITDYIEVYKGGNSGGSPDPNETGLQFGYAAAALLAKFVEWLLNNGWSKGSEVNTGFYQSLFSAVLNGEDIIFETSVVERDETNGNYSLVKQGTVLPLNLEAEDDILYYYESPNYGSPSKAVNLFGIPTGNSEYPYAYFRLSVGNYNWLYYIRLNSAGSLMNTKVTLSSFATDNGFQSSDFVGIVGFETANSINTETCPVGILTNSGTVLFTGWYFPKPDSVIISSESTVTIPEEVPDIIPSENEGVLIDTGIDISTLDSPEQLAEIIKKKFEDDGTITKPQTIIQTDETVNPSPSPQLSPSPAPTPVVEDIEDLGLPQLGEALQNKFPFCLPDDLRDLFSILAAEPQTPKWEFDLFATLGNRVPFVGDTSISIDLGEYEEIGVICRWASVISFCIFLILTTKGMIGW